MNLVNDYIEYYALFPYINKSILYVNSLNISINDIIMSPSFEAVRINGENKILDSIAGKLKKKYLFTRGEMLVELLSYPYIKILLSCINERALIRKYIFSEAFSSIFFIKSSSNFSEKELLSFALDLDLDVTIEHDNLFLVHFSDFIKYSTRFKDISWKLINMELKNGYVLVKLSNFLRFLQEVIYCKIEKSFSFDIPKNICEICLKQSNDILLFYQEYQKNNEKLLFDEISIKKKVEINSFPLCIKNALAQLQSGINLSHSMRFSLVSFLNLIGMDKEKIYNLFLTSPDFNVSQVKYQINHIINKKYKCPSCSTMKTYGNCIDTCPYFYNNNNPIYIYFKNLKKS